MLTFHRQVLALLPRAVERLRARSPEAEADAPRPLAPAPSLPEPEPSSPRPEPSPPPVDRLAEIWPNLVTDLRGLQDVANQLTPTPALESRLRSRLVHPAPVLAGRTMRALLDALPERITHLFVPQRLSQGGGSEFVTMQFVEMLRRHYDTGGLCIFGPDEAFTAGPGLSPAPEVPVVSINGIAPGASLEDRIEMFDRVMIERRPASAHSANSFVAWTAFERRAAFYCRDTNLFGSIYSDLRVADGVPAAYYFWKSLPQTIDHLSGVITDNRRIIRTAEENFGFTRAEISRHHVVRTPVLGLPRGTLALRPYRSGAPRRSLWLSRIAAEKALDVLADIAARCPQREFEIHGSQALDAPVDLGWVETASNVTMRGRFETLGDLPVENFDSYVFTTRGEGMPISLLEMTALGLPIVAPQIGGIGEFIDQDTGWLVSGSHAVEEYAEALEEIARHPEEAARRVREAQRRLLDRHTMHAFRRSIEAIPGYLH